VLQHELQQLAALRVERALAVGAEDMALAVTLPGAQAAVEVAAEEQDG
jgi:hypothetical protein